MYYCWYVSSYNMSYQRNGNITIFEKVEQILPKILPQKNRSSIEKVLKTFCCITKKYKKALKYTQNKQKRLYREENGGGGL